MKKRIGIFHWVVLFIVAAYLVARDLFFTFKESPQTALCIDLVFFGVLFLFLWWFDRKTPEGPN